MERADGDLWLKVLDESNKSRKSLVDQVVGTALPESRNPEQVRGALRVRCLGTFMPIIISYLQAMLFCCA